MTREEASFILANIDRRVCDDELNEALDMAIKALERSTGFWKPIGYDGYADGYPVIEDWECSECGWEHSGDSDTLTPFCPNCGAKMVEPQESEG